MPEVHGACPHDCPDTCAWLVEVKDGRAVGLRGDPDHPFTGGALCSKLKRYAQRVYSPDRVLYPQRRVGPKGEGRFERVSWDTAIAEITDRLKAAVAAYGPLTAMPNSFAGTIGLLHRYAGDQFFARLGATGVERTICGNVALDGVSTTIGPVEGVMPEDLLHSRFILIWGTNTVATNLHLWTAVIRRAKAAGARVVVVDPVRTETARSADQHVQLRPGTDSALALGMMHVIVRDGLHDQDFIDRHTHGFDALRGRLADYPPERVEAITGIAAAVIVELAHAYATTRPAVVRLSVGMERHANGGMMNRTVACLPGLIGAWRERGGGLLQFTSLTFMQVLNHAAIQPPAELPQPARSTHLGRLGAALTDADMDPPVTWLMVYNSNPMVSATEQNLVRRGLAREDLFTVVHEQFMTDTAKYADYVLPATTQFEHLELMPAWGQPYLAFNPPAIAPLGEALPNTELFRRLSTAMGFDDDYLHRSDEDRIRMLLASDHPFVAGITYERLERDGWARLNIPDDFAPLAEGRFATPSGKLEFYSDQLAAAGRDPLPAHVPIGDTVNDADYPLTLISAKSAHFLNSNYVNLRHPGTAAHEPQVQLHPDDAAARRIGAGDAVRVFNLRGEVQVRARVSNDTPAGTVYLPFNWWPDCAANHQSANALTPDGLADRGMGSIAFDARVEVAAV